MNNYELNGMKMRLVFSIFSFFMLLLQSVYANYSTLPDSRLLTFDDYADLTKWTHSSEVPRRRDKGLKTGITHQHVDGWVFSEARTGTCEYMGNSVPPLVSTNYACNFRNVAGAYLESPYYTNGIGTIYFDAVNNENATSASVYIATNMFVNGGGFVPLLPEEDDTNSFNWVELDVVDLDYSVEGEFYRYFRKLNLRGPVKFKVVRNGVISGYDEDSQFLVIDNIRVSYSPTDVAISKSEVVNNPGYPNAKSNFTVRCTVDNLDANVPTEVRAVYLVYRWRYLDQQVNPWRTNVMEYVEGTGDGNGNGEAFEGVVSKVEDEGDIEYYFSCAFGGYVYESPDYTLTGVEYPYPSEDLSPIELRSNSGNDFSIHLRSYDSRYGSLSLFTDQHEEPIEMRLVGDHQWRGLVPVSSIAPIELCWSIMGEAEYIEGSDTFETNFVHWSSAESINGSVSTLPCSGVCVETNSNGRSLVSISSGSYMEVNFDTETLQFEANAAQYQNFNSWITPVDLFCASSVSLNRQCYENSFDQYLISIGDIIVEPFNYSGSVDDSFDYEPFETPDGWNACSAGYVKERTIDGVYAPVGMADYRNRSLRLNGSEAIYGPGFVYNSASATTDGLKSIRLKTHLGESSSSVDICYELGYFATSNYSYNVQCSALQLSPDNPSLSLIAYYQDYNNYYEFRVVQIQDPADTDAVIRDARVECILLKWVDGTVQELASASPDMDVNLLQSQDVRVTLYNVDESTTMIKCDLGTLDNVISVDDSSTPLRFGTCGFVSSECASAFTFADIQNSTSDAEPVGSGEVVVLGGSAYEVSAQISNWFVPTGSFAFDTSSVPSGVYKSVTNQLVDLYIQSGEYGSGQDPAAPGTIDWTLFSQINVSAFTNRESYVEIKKSQSPFVLLQVSGMECDVVVDELELTSWTGESLGGPANEWSVNVGWIAAGDAQSVSNNILQLDISRAYSDEDQFVRSPLMDNGMGAVEFDYRAIVAPARITLQYALSSAPENWVDVQSLYVSNITEWAHASIYVGQHDAGFIRVLNDRRGGYDNAAVDVDDVVALDHPAENQYSWSVYNARITSSDPMRLFPDESRGCFLNNSTTEETAPSSLDEDTPGIKSPVLVGGLEKLSFFARAYESNETAVVYVYASTNGWSSPGDQWVLVHQFDSIDHPFYRQYSWSPSAGQDYDAIRLETEIGGARVCIEEIVISESESPFVYINSNLDPMHGKQNGMRVSQYLLQGEFGFSTNIHYEVDDWYRLVSLTTNGVEQLASGSQLTSYNMGLSNVLHGIAIQTTLELCDVLIGYQSNTSMVEWIAGYPENDFVPMTYMGGQLSMEDQYMLGADPTTSNEFHCFIEEFSLDAQTNLHVRLKMSLNSTKLTNLQGDAVLKLQAKQNLDDAEWTSAAQYSLSADSFNSENECLAVIANPFEGELAGYDPAKLFLRWVIESDDPLLVITELNNQDGE